MKQNTPQKETIKEIAKRCNITEQTYYNWKKHSLKRHLIENERLIPLV